MMFVVACAQTSQQTFQDVRHKNSAIMIGHVGLNIRSAARAYVLAAARSATDHTRHAPVL